MAKNPEFTFSNIASWVHELKKLGNFPEPEAKKNFNCSADKLINSLTRFDQRYKIIFKSAKNLQVNTSD